MDTNEEFEAKLRNVMQHIAWTDETRDHVNTLFDEYRGSLRTAAFSGANQVERLRIVAAAEEKLMSELWVMADTENEAPPSELS